MIQNQAVIKRGFTELGAELYHSFPPFGIGGDLRQFVLEKFKDCVDYQGWKSGAHFSSWQSNYSSIEGIL